jgi:rubrerythrin
MKIEQAISHIKTQINLKRTSYGRPINDDSLNRLNSVLEDENNFGADAVQCLNCGLIISSLVVSDGCPNCGGIDMTFEILEKKITKD